MGEPYIDHRGYLRDYNNRLVHRQIAYKHIYKRHKRNFRHPFRFYVVHHKNGNKLDNNVSNLEILEQEEHGEIHRNRRVRRIIFIILYIFLGIPVFGLVGIIIGTITGKDILEGVGFIWLVGLFYLGWKLRNYY